MFFLSNLVFLFFYQVNYFVILKALYLMSLPAYSKKVFQLFFKVNFIKTILKYFFQYNLY